MARPYEDDEFLALSGLQHFIFCRRQWALIHLECQWADNYLTVTGSQLHERAHDELIREHRGDLVVLRGLNVHSRALGLRGVCDVVELRRDETGVEFHGLEGLWNPIPVEYKRGRPKNHRADEVQVTAQAMCLEEMLCCKVDRAQLFYGSSRRRHDVALDDGLRSLVSRTIVEMHRMFDAHHTPKVRMGDRCKSCSFRNLCLPELSGLESVSSYMRRKIGEDR